MKPVIRFKEVISIIMGILVYIFAVGTVAHAEVQQVEVVNPITLSQPAAPSAPIDVVISGITENSATISFSPAPGASGYSVWIDGDRFTGAASPGTEIKGLQPDTTYSVYVTASNDGGESEPSDSSYFTTLSPVPTQPADPVVLSVSGDSAEINWETLPPWQNILAYRVYVDGIAVADVEPQAGTQAANLTNLSSGVHSVSVSGINNNREGPLSVPVQFTIQVLPPITGLKMINHSPDTIYLSWDPVENTGQYLINIGGQAVGATSQPRYALSGLEPDNEYEITVTSAMLDGNQTQAATLEAKTLPITASYNTDTIIRATYAYIPNVMPGVVAVFSVGIAFTIARFAKLSIGSRYYFRYWR